MENTTSPRPATIPATPRFTLRRSRTERMVGGVCGGLAESLQIDIALLRIGLVALTLIGGGIGIPLYVAAWILAPESDPAVTGVPAAGANGQPEPGSVSPLS